MSSPILFVIPCVTPEKGDAPGCLETEEGINLSDWARSVGERSYQVTHIYFFGSKIRGNPAKNDTDVFLLLETMSSEEQQELVGMLYTAPEVDFPGLDLFLNFQMDATW